jgi:hypothetical protein
MARIVRDKARERERQRGVKRRARERALAADPDAYRAAQAAKARTYRAERKRIREARLKNKPINLTGIFDDV